MQSTRQPLSRAESDEAENSMASARIHDTPRYPRFSDHLRDGAWWIRIGDVSDNMYYEVWQ